MKDYKINISDVTSLKEFQEQYSIQLLLEKLDTSNYSNTLSEIKKYLVDELNLTKRIVITRTIFQYAEARYLKIDLYIKLIYDLEKYKIKELCIDERGYIKDNDMILLAKRLYEEKIFSKRFYDNLFYSQYKNFPERPNQICYSDTNKNFKESYINDINTLAPIIDIDDSEKLKLSLEKYNNDFNFNFKAIPHKFKEEEEISLIQYSALRGAEKCFNFLLKNKAKYDPKKSCYALEGGNLNIIKNFECYDIKYAIKSLNSKVFDLCSKNYNANEILISCCNNNFLYGINFFKNIYLKNPLQYFSKNTEISKILIEKYYKGDSFIQYKNYSNYDLYSAINAGQPAFDAAYEKCKELKINLVVDSILHTLNTSFLRHIFLNYHASINSKGFQGYTPIIRACELNDEVLFYFLIEIDKLLKEKINFFEKTEYGEDIFIIDCEKCYDDEFLKCLYNKGLYYNTKEYYDNYKIDALGMAIYKNRVQTVDFLLKQPNTIPCRYAWYNAQHYYFKTTHIQLAINNGNKQIIELILKHPKLSLTIDERNKIKNKFPDIDDEILNNVCIRAPNKYDKHEDEYPEDWFCEENEFRDESSEDEKDKEKNQSDEMNEENDEENNEKENNIGDE